MRPVALPVLPEYVFWQPLQRYRWIFVRVRPHFWRRSSPQKGHL
jgi:hypothetical protein